MSLLAHSCITSLQSIMWHLHSCWLTENNKQYLQMTQISTDTELWPNSYTDHYIIVITCNWCSSFMWLVWLWHGMTHDLVTYLAMAGDREATRWTDGGPSIFPASSSVSLWDGCLQGDEFIVTVLNSTSKCDTYLTGKSSRLKKVHNNCLFIDNRFHLSISSETEIQIAFVTIMYLYFVNILKWQVYYKQIKRSKAQNRIWNWLHHIIKSNVQNKVHSTSFFHVGRCRWDSAWPLGNDCGVRNRRPSLHWGKTDVWVRP